MNQSSNLLILLERTNNLKQNIHSANNSLIEQDLSNIFNDLRNYLNPLDLEIGLQIMANGTIILSQKIEEIRCFIENLSQRDQILNFIQNVESDEILNDLILQAIQFPIILPSLSIEFVANSYDQLVTNKVIRNYAGNPLNQNLDIYLKKQDSDITEFEKSFETRMNEYYNTIISYLPLTLQEILEKDQNKDDYFDHFSLILHLLQDGKLVFDRTTKIFDIKK